MTSTDIAYYYYADRNVNNSFMGFVPMADIPQEQFDRLESWQQDSIAAQPFFLKTKPRAPKADAPPSTTLEETT